MLGCGLEPNTSIHAIEELVEPPYLFDPPITYTITNQNGRTFKKEYLPHNFNGWRQRYERISNIMKSPAIRTGKVLEAQFELIEAGPLREAGLKALKSNPLFFVDKIHQTDFNGV